MSTLAANYRLVILLIIAKIKKKALFKRFLRKIYKNNASEFKYFFNNSFCCISVIKIIIFIIEFSIFFTIFFEISIIIFNCFEFFDKLFLITVCYNRPGKFLNINVKISNFIFISIKIVE